MQLDEIAEFRMGDQPKISVFFKEIKSLPVEKSTSEKISRPVGVHNQFYNDCLQQQHECQNELCVKAKCELYKKKEEIREKIRKNEDAIRICSMVVSEKDQEIERLRKQFESIETNESQLSNFNTVPDIASQSISNATASAEKETMSFGAFLNDFTEQELAVLRSVGDNSRDDSTFVSSAMKYLYKENIDVLKQKSLTGRTTKSGQTKQPMTPEKYDTLSRIFSERINAITSDHIQKEIRTKRFNKFIKDAINNINKATQTKEIEKKACELLKETNK